MFKIGDLKHMWLGGCKSYSISAQQMLLACMRDLLEGPFRRDVKIAGPSDI